MNNYDLIAVNNTCENIKDVLLKEFPTGIYNEETEIFKLDKIEYEVYSCNVINEIHDALSYYILVKE